MAHLFISYSHSDKALLSNFVERIEREGFSTSGENKDIWIDHSGIEGGEDWRNEIDLALEESFAVVVLLTKNSVKSSFVLYEWTWALGNAIKVIPILMESIEVGDLPRDFRHPLYERKQYKNWNEPNDKEYIIYQLKELKIFSPLDIRLGIAIGEIIVPTRIYLETLLWTYPYANPKKIVSHEDY